jgi:hypothetical protein
VHQLTGVDEGGVGGHLRPPRRGVQIHGPERIHRGTAAASSAMALGSGDGESGRAMPMVHALQCAEYAGAPGKVEPASTRRPSLWPKWGGRRRPPRGPHRRFRRIRRWDRHRGRDPSGMAWIWQREGRRTTGG